jgi:hypothetical protein
VRGMAGGAHEKLLVLTFVKDEMATSTPPRLQHHTSGGYRITRKGFLEAVLPPA